MMCAHCRRPLLRLEVPASTRAWCGGACMAAWDSAHPEEAARWIRVGEMTPLQRSELLALIGKGERC